MRRTTSILALCAAALMSAATSGPEPTAHFSVEPISVTVDPADPPVVTVTFDASWSEEARQRARIEVAYMRVTISDLPAGVTVVGTDAGGVYYDGGPGGLIINDYCTEDACDNSVDVTFEGPVDGEPFTVEVGATLSVQVGSDKDVPDVVGEITLSGPGAG